MSFPSSHKINISEPCHSGWTEFHLKLRGKDGTEDNLTGDTPTSIFNLISYFDGFEFRASKFSYNLEN